MARKRMIDPGLWRDKKVIQLTNDELIVWIGCISNADDEGILEPDPQSFYFELARTELSAEKIRKAFDVLAEKGLIVRYGSYAFIPTWFKHQNLNRPHFTKHRRPPATIVERYREYVEAWEQTFSTKEKPITYPYSTCHAEPKIDHGGITDRSVNDHGTVNANRKERNGSEGKGSEEYGDSDEPPAISPPASLPAESDPDLELYRRTKEAFESQYGEFEPGMHAKEGAAIKQLIRKARQRAPDDPAGFLKAAMVMFMRLKRDGHRLFGDQPFLPSRLNSAGLWPVVVENMRTRVEEQEALAVLEGVQI